MPRRLVLAALALASCAHRPVGPASAAGDAPPGWSGPARAELDLLRPEPGGSRIYVQARLPDQELGLFLVDTGAAISALSSETAERLGLTVQDTGGYVSGLGGQAPLLTATLGSLALGEAVVPDVEFAVGVRGVPENAGAMPLDGILGNNVWSLFDLEIDYPADRMVLHRPGGMRMPARSEPLFFDGSFVFTPIVVTTAASPPHSDRVIIQVDTGAGELLLSGPTGSGIARDYTEGIEQIRGIGASETLPPSKFLQATRRVPLSRVSIGGRDVAVDFDARWLNFEGGAAAVGPEGMRGLAGHELLAGHVAKFDYAGGRFALERSRRRPRQLDGHEILLDQDLARHGDDPARGLARARLELGRGEGDAAKEWLRSYLVARPDDAEARILLAAVQRADGELAAMRETLAPVSAGELVDEGEILSIVNGLVLDGDLASARAMAERALAERPDEALAHVAMSDVLLASGDADGANVGLIEAARLEGYPDAFLIRRARVSLARGDHNAALAHLRKLLQLYPSGGPFLWFYAMLVEDTGDVDTFRADMESAIARLHPQHRPLDFMVAAHSALGDPEVAATLMDQGIARDCDQDDTASRDNCVAWYLALARRSPDEALQRVDRALASEGERSDFLDTKAMVHLGRGEYDEAIGAAIAAARLSPDDWYMLWQADRIEELARRADAESAARRSSP